MSILGHLEVPVSDVVADEVLATESLEATIEAGELVLELNELTADLTQAELAQEGLQVQSDIISGLLATPDTITSGTVAMATAGHGSVVMAIGGDAPVVLSTESVDANPVAALELGNEGIKDTLKKVIDAIKAIFKKITDGIKKLVVKAIVAVSAQKGALKKLTAELEANTVAKPIEKSFKGDDAKRFTAAYTADVEADKAGFPTILAKGGFAKAVEANLKITVDSLGYLSEAINTTGDIDLVKVIGGYDLLNNNALIGAKKLPKGTTSKGTPIGGHVLPLMATRGHVVMIPVVKGTTDLVEFGVTVVAIKYPVLGKPDVLSKKEIASLLSAATDQAEGMSDYVKYPLANVGVLSDIVDLTAKQDDAPDKVMKARGALVRTCRSVVTNGLAQSISVYITMLQDAVWVAKTNLAMYKEAKSK